MRFLYNKKLLARPDERPLGRLVREYGAAVWLTILLGVMALPTRAAELSAQQLGRYPMLGATVVGKRVVGVGEFGMIVSSADNGRRWTRLTTPTEETLTDVFFVEDGNGWAVGHHGTILHSADGGKNWIVQTPDKSAVDPLLGVFFIDARHGFAVGAFGLLLETSDGGKIWRNRDVGQGEMHLKAVGGDKEGRLYIAGETGSVLISSDHGATWVRTETGYKGSLWRVLVPGPESVLVFGMRGTVFRSDDKGRSWSSVETGTKAGLSAGVALTPKNIVLAGAEGTVLASRNGGRSFTAVQIDDRRGIAAAAATSSGSVLLLGRITPTTYTLTLQTP